MTGSSSVTYGTTWAHTKSPFIRHQNDYSSGGRCPRIEYPKLRSVDVTSAP